MDAEVEHNVLDGGSLLHRLKWSEGKTYCSMADDYASFAVRHYGKATVVFDGHSGGPNTKDITHQRRRRNRASNKVNIVEGAKFIRKGGLPIKCGEQTVAYQSHRTTHEGQRLPRGAISG